MGRSTKGCKTGIFLFKVRKILVKRLHAGRTEKYNDIVENFFQIRQITYHGFEKHRWGKIITVFSKPVLRLFSGHVRTREEKLLFRMFFQYLLQILGGLLSKENFTLSVLDVFLKVKCNGFRETEILQIGRHIVAHLFTDAEKMINSILAGKNDSSKIGQINTLFSEVLRWNPLHMNKRSEI